MKFSEIPLFRGIGQRELEPLLDCLHARTRAYQKGETILPAGRATEYVGVVLSGRAVISFDDAWGNTSILGDIAPGAAFAEAYACMPGQPLLVSVLAAEDTSVLFLNVGRMMASCTDASPFHARLTRNLLSVCAEKNLRLSRKIQHTSSKTIRGRLMSYFSECARGHGRDSFRIPYNRQQLADYLGVDRSALCGELSKMRRDGLIAYDGNLISLRGRKAET